jgi:uncharacterized protein (TIGR03067 family)
MFAVFSILAITSHSACAVLRVVPNQLLASNLTEATAYMGASREMGHSIPSTRLPPAPTKQLRPRRRIVHWWFIIPTACPKATLSPLTGGGKSRHNPHHCPGKSAWGWYGEGANRVKSEGAELMRVMPGRFLGMCLLLAAGGWLVPVVSPALVHGQDQAYTPLRGRWQAVELVDDGRVIPQDAIHTWIPSGDQFEVIDNTFVFTSSADGQRHARTFDVDATRYPREINFRADGQLYAHGIYQLDQGRCVICAATSNGVARPNEFSAPKGSRRVLLVLKHPADAVRLGEQPATAAPQVAPQAAPPATAAPQAAPPAAIEISKLPPPPDLRSPPGNTGKLLTDAEVVRMLLGTWRYNDAYGDFFLTLDSNGAFNTFRETATTSAFQQVFVRAPVSLGTWSLNNGLLTFRCTASVQRDRINQQIPYAVRSISENDLIFVDSRGQVAKAVKVR